MGRKVKRGKLVNVGKLDPATAAATAVKRTTTKETTKNKAPKRPGINKKTSKKNSDSSMISPLLSDYMSLKDDDDTMESTSDKKDATAAVTTTPEAVLQEVDATTFTEFVQDDQDEEELQSTSRKNKKKSARRSRKKGRQAVDEVRRRKVELLTDEMNEMLDPESIEDDDEKKQRLKKMASNVGDNILSLLRQLMDNVPTGNLRQLTAGSANKDFRLAWVGSDEAVCHLCTGLHKVPLARLQEIFMSLPGRNAVKVQEVIRIIGPFPSVKNTLQGESSMERIGDIEENNGVVVWKIVWGRMTDGTGKELMSGKDERIVDLQVLFSDPAIIVAAVPPNIDDPFQRRTDPLENGGKHVLVFLREDNLDDKLELLRVA